MSINLPTRRLVSQQDSAMIESAEVPRSRFTGSWTRKTTFDAGYLIPFLVDDVLPGDHLSYSVTAYIRIATLLYPMFDSQRIDTHFFFVPNRLVWADWEKFMGAQAAPNDAIDVTVPQLQSYTGGFPVGQVWDHMGLPGFGQVALGEVLRVSVLPFRMYNLIYNEWFRDENLQPSYPVFTHSLDETAEYTLIPRCKAHDYFTSALPYPQKFTAPLVPFSGFAPVVGLGTIGATIAGPGGNIQTTKGIVPSPAFVAPNIYMTAAPGGAGLPQVYADLAVASGIPINVLRQAWLVQSLLERDARGGTRYTEIVRSHFRVTSPDARLQRPEYIGGGSSQLGITPIAQTSPSEDQPLGALGAAGTAVGQHKASFAATEHGYIIGLISVRSELSYQQGVPRHFSRKTRYDFYWPSLAGLGEQAILRKEIYADGDVLGDDLVFGYQERWHEYRTRYSEVTGLFRSTSAGTLDPWHLGERFIGGVVLGDAFIRDKPPMIRVLAAAELAAGAQYMADINIRRDAVRPVSAYGTPASIGRF